MPSERLDPLYGIYDDIATIVRNIVIKYNVTAEKYETLQSKLNGDQYITAVNMMDRFEDYTTYTTEDCINAGMTNPSDIALIVNGITNHPGYTYSQMNELRKYYNQLVRQFGDKLLEIRRKRIIDEYVEMNDYYRMLNGYPNLNEDPKNFFYISDEIALNYEIDPTIPIHLIQDHYNKIEYGLGDYYINIVDGLGWIDVLKANNPEAKYLNYIGSKRISIEDARQASNFEILKLEQGILSNAIYEEFTTLYSQARSYFTTVVYQPYHRNVIDYYDNFIAMCIMVMTINQLLMRQMDLAISRNYYNKQSIKMLYEAYNIPYNMNIDDDTQKQICQNLNLLIQDKATDRVLYNIIELLGYSNLSIYKYYMVRERKYDDFGVPIVAYTKKFNNDTGEYEDTYDYQKMYDVYFERCDLKDNDILESFRSEVNKTDYATVTSDDSYWWEDSNLQKQVWETEYNYVESKYLSLGISYKMSEIMYENIMLLKMLMDQKSPLSSITFTLPKIIDSSTEVTIFDAIIMLCCLTCKSHELTGEIITVPSQVISVLDYLRNNDSAYNETCDSFAFDFSDFMGKLDLHKHYKNFSENQKYTEVDYSYSQYISDLCDNKIKIEGVDYDFKQKYRDLVNANLSEEFNFKTYPYEYYKLDIINENITFDNIGIETARNLLQYFTDEEKEKFFKYLSVLSIDENAPNSEKVKAINSMYANLKNLSGFINFMISKAETREEYEALKTFYRTVYYSRENKEMFSNILGIDIGWFDEDGGYYIRNHDGTPNKTYSYYDKDHNLISNDEPADIVDELKESGELTVGEVQVKRAAKTYFEFLMRYNPKAYAALFTTDEANQFSEYLNKNGMTVGNYCTKKFNEYVDAGLITGQYTNFDKYLESLYPSYETDRDTALYDYGKKQFMNEVALGTISIAYDTLVVDGNLLYAYVDHIISKLSEVIDGLKFLYLMEKSASPLEKLLVQMIRFFKSYTVDMIGLNLLYVYDVKIDNIIKLFDEVNRIHKTITPMDRIRIRYDDSVHCLIATIVPKDKIHFTDRVQINARLNVHDHLYLWDNVSIFGKEINGNERLELYDVGQKVESTITTKSSLKLTDKVRMYYSE